MTELNGADVEATQVGSKAHPHVSLHAILSALPQETMLPAGWVLERIAGSSASAASLQGTLSAQEFGDQRVPRRTADWVRQQCAEGRIEGARKDGGEWRVPISSLALPLRPRAGEIGAASYDASSTDRSNGAPIYPRWRRETQERAG